MFKIYKMSSKMAKFSQKNDNYWDCNFCEKKFRHQSSLCKHITKKHTEKKMSKWLKMGENGNKMVTKNTKTFEKGLFICDHCNKIYKYASGLSRHKKSCKEKKSEQLQNIKNINNIKIEKNITNIENQNISINFYLNTFCKNALNLGDFIKKIELSLKDVLNTKRLGYSGGVSNILIKNMNDLPQNERPLQCFDIKPLEYYVKENDEWQKNGQKELTSAINNITTKQIRELKEWCKKNPDYLSNDMKQVEYLKMTQKLIGSYEDDEKELEKNTIIENICKNNKVEFKSID